MLLREWSSDVDTARPLVSASTQDARSNLCIEAKIEAEERTDR